MSRRKKKIYIIYRDAKFSMHCIRAPRVHARGRRAICSAESNAAAVAAGTGEARAPPNS